MRANVKNLSNAKTLPNESASKYTLQVGKDGEKRLDILNELYNPLSKKFITNAGINGRKKLLDVACGTGEMSCWMAQNTSGNVLAVDISEKQLAIGRKKAESLGLKNIEFKRLSVFELKNISEKFDFIYCRFLLVHIQNALMALQMMFDRLDDNGVLACEEATASASFCYPKAPAFEKWLQLWAALRKANGTELDLGLKLPDMFRVTGFVDVNTNLVQPVLQTPRQKSVLRLNTIETTNAAISAKFDSKEGMSQLATDLEKLETETHLIGYVRNSQVFGYKKLKFLSQEGDHGLPKSGKTAPFASKL